MSARCRPSTPGTGGGSRGSGFLYAESDDGFEWTKPNLGMAEFPKGSGNKNNNLLENDCMTTGIYLDVRPQAKIVADACAVF